MASNPGNNCSKSEKIYKNAFFRKRCFSSGESSEHVGFSFDNTAWKFSPEDLKYVPVNVKMQFHDDPENSAICSRMIKKTFFSIIYKLLPKILLDKETSVFTTFPQNIRQSFKKKLNQIPKLFISAHVRGSFDNSTDIFRYLFQFLLEELQNWRSNWKVFLKKHSPKCSSGEVSCKLEDHIEKFF